MSERRRKNNVPCRLPALVHEQRGRCFYCGEKFRESSPPLRPATVDHKTPLSRGGRDQAPNLVAACRACNQKKGSLTLEEFECLRRHFPSYW